MVGAPSGLFIGFRANRLPAHISLDIHIVALASADLDQDCRHRSAAAALDPDIIAVFLRRESCCRPLASIDTQPRALDVLVIDDPLAVAGRDVVAARVVRNFESSCSRTSR